MAYKRIAVMEIWEACEKVRFCKIHGIFREQE